MTSGVGGGGGGGGQQEEWYDVESALTFAEKQTINVRGRQEQQQNGRHSSPSLFNLSFFPSLSPYNSPSVLKKNRESEEGVEMFWPLLHPVTWYTKMDPIKPKFDFHISDLQWTFACHLPPPLADSRINLRQPRSRLHWDAGGRNPPIRSRPVASTCRQLQAVAGGCKHLRLVWRC